MTFLALLGAFIAAPIYWVLVPQQARKDVFAVASLVGLGLYDVRLPVVVVTLIGLLHIALRIVAVSDRTGARRVLASAFAVLFALFAYNKLSGGHQTLGVLATQGTLAFLGMSYFVLKAAAILIETARGAIEPPSFVRVARWMVFLPIFPSGPIEDFRHFDAQQPYVDADRISRGIERILFGLVRALILAHYLAVWAMPILAAPAGHSRLILLLAAYAFTVRFYFDFAGYSDIAIGLAALYGYEIQENFDRPLARRNLVQLWQHWHMTLTTWMRLYLFIPLSRSLLRRRYSHYVAVIAGQIWAMLFCGLWHGLKWEFVLWGLAHSIGLIWMALFARPLGRRLPAPVVAWWRHSPAAVPMSWFLTFNTFALVNVIAAGNLSTTVTYFTRLVGVR